MKKLQLRQFNNLFQVYDPSQEKVIAIFDSEQAARNFIINEIEDQNLILSSSNPQMGPNNFMTPPPMGPNNFMTPPPMGPNNFMTPPPMMPWNGAQPSIGQPLGQNCQQHQVQQCSTCSQSSHVVNNLSQNDGNSLNMISGLSNMMNSMITGFGSMMTTMSKNNSTDNSPKKEEKSLDPDELIRKLDERERMKKLDIHLYEAEKRRQYDDNFYHSRRENRYFDYEQPQYEKRREDKIKPILEEIVAEPKIAEKIQEPQQPPVYQSVQVVQPNQPVQPTPIIQQPIIQPTPIIQQQPIVEEITPIVEEITPIVEEITDEFDGLDEIEEIVEEKQNLVNDSQQDILIAEETSSGARLRNKSDHDNTSHVDEDIYKLSDMEDSQEVDFNDYTSSFNFEISEFKDNGGAFIKKSGKKGKLANIDDKSLGETSAYENLEILNTPSKRVIADDQLVKVDYTKTIKNDNFGKNLRKVLSEPIIIEPTVELDNTMDNLNGALAFELQRSLDKNKAIDNNQTVEVTSMLVGEKLNESNYKDDGSVLDLGPEADSIEFVEDATIEQEEASKDKKADQPKLSKVEQKLAKKEAAQEKKDEKRRLKLEKKWK
ncbi:hypothetical protein [Spiroplasma alleghenense]|uniref:Uncharacterized protein n=1 Tax=Spiroplasma alleghenense TaxID=216931 RepID=A0A345Z275_9MOLU|nr:hypothetical protein [Spiroplasma alleghenense]AXK50704.1 hypothetical protein SALLE_v1c00280 [Spiroplasma alleghenense]